MGYGLFHVVPDPAVYHPEPTFRPVKTNGSVSFDTDELEPHAVVHKTLFQLAV